jgi:hypothetical protein
MRWKVGQIDCDHVDVIPGADFSLLLFIEAKIVEPSMKVGLERMYRSDKILAQWMSDYSYQHSPPKFRDLPRRSGSIPMKQLSQLCQDGIPKQHSTLNSMSRH